MLRSILFMVWALAAPLVAAQSGEPATSAGDVEVAKPRPAAPASSAAVATPARVAQSGGEPSSGDPSSSDPSGSEPLGHPPGSEEVSPGSEVGTAGDVESERDEPLDGVEPESRGRDERFGLDPELLDALRELKDRDRRTYVELRRALRNDPEQARERLEQHAQYLLELREAQAENPRRFELLRDQQVSEVAVRDAADRFRSSSGEERRAARDRLRRLLEEGFELRHELRQLQHQAMLERLADARERIAAASEDPASARRRWLEELVTEEEGGEATEPVGVEELRTLAPLLLEGLMRVDPRSARHLVRVSERSPGVFLRKLESRVEAHPELLAEARRRALSGPEDVRDRLQSRVRSARERVGRWSGPPGSGAVPPNGRRLEGRAREPRAREPRRGVPPGPRRAPFEGRSFDRRPIDLTPEQRAELEPVLDEIVEAELSVSRLNLERVEERLGELQSLLEFRRRNKDVIVDLRLAELTGEGERYEW